MFPFSLFIIAIMWPFCMINSALSGFDSYFFFTTSFFSFIDYDIVSGVLICLPVEADVLSSFLACGIV